MRSIIICVLLSSLLAIAYCGLDGFRVPEWRAKRGMEPRFPEWGAAVRAKRGDAVQVHGFEPEWGAAVRVKRGNPFVRIAPEWRVKRGIHTSVPFPPEWRVKRGNPFVRIAPEWRVKRVGAAMTVGGPTYKLSNGVEMPAVGLGTWQSKGADVKKAVLEAIDVGYRLIDTAAVYGNEEMIGEAVQEAIAAGKIKREDLFITTKVWANYFAPEDVCESVRESLRRLKLDYVNLVLAHVPTAFTKDGSKFNLDVKPEDTWRGLEKCYNDGLAKAIGVSNWNNSQIARVLKSGTIPVHNSQVELHLHFPQKEHHEFCKQHNIVVTSYATLGSPGRVDFKIEGVKINWVQAPPDLENAQVKELAQKHNKTPAQILLRYLLDRGIAVIPKSVTPSRIKENFQLFDFKLTLDEIQQLESSGQNQRLFLQQFMEGHPEDPFAAERK